MPANNQSPRGNHFANNPSGNQASHMDRQTPAYTPARGQAAGAGQRPATRTVSPSAYTNSYQPCKRNAGKIAGWTLGIILIAVLAFGGTLGALLFKDAKTIMGQSQSMLNEASTLKDALQNGDGDTLNATANSLAGQMSGIKRTIDSPAWTIASFIPVLGEDVTFARGLVTQADSLVQDGLLPACSSLADFKLSNLMKDGAIDVNLLDKVVNTFVDIEPAVASAAKGIDALPEPHIGKLRELSNKISGPINTAAAVIPKINEVAPLLPPMLGANGPRHYLLMAQNNSELRATGGLPGSVGTLTLDQGKLELGEFEGSNQIKGTRSPAEHGVTAEEAALYTDRVAGRMTDTNINPDFPRVAYFASMLWTEQFGGNIDGVIMIDPIFLQYLLGLTGGFEAEGISVNGDNAARMLIHDAYNMMSVEQTDLFFSAAAGKAFDSIINNMSNIGMTDLVNVLTRSVKEGRFLVWMKDVQEETAMVTLGCAGEIKTDETKPELGVFFSDETWSKISWYFSDTTVVGEGTKNADGSTTYHVTTTMRNNLTLSEARKQVAYITGLNSIKRSVADMYMHMYLIPPAGGSISNVKTTGASFSPQPITTMPYNGIQVTTGSYLLDGGKTATVTYDVTTSPKATEPIAVRTTPTAQGVAGWDQPAESAQ